MKSRKIAVIAHDVRSCHNVGSLLRTTDGLGVQKLYLTGYTPYPQMKEDKRLPHLSAKIDRQIRKTALGAEKTVNWRYRADCEKLLKDLKKQGYLIAAVEQGRSAKPLNEFKSDNKPIALVVGSEIGGLASNLLELADVRLEIPMLGHKESFNVTVAAAMAMYHFRFYA